MREQWPNPKWLIRSFSGDELQGLRGIPRGFALVEQEAISHSGWFTNECHLYLLFRNTKRIATIGMAIRR